MDSLFRGTRSPKGRRIQFQIIYILIMHNLIREYLTDKNKRGNQLLLAIALSVSVGQPWC